MAIDATRQAIEEYLNLVDEASKQWEAVIQKAQEDLLTSIQGVVNSGVLLPPEQLVTPTQPSKVSKVPVAPAPPAAPPGTVPVDEKVYTNLLGKLETVDKIAKDHPDIFANYPDLFKAIQ